MTICAGFTAETTPPEKLEKVKPAAGVAVTVAVDPDVNQPPLDTLPDNAGLTEVVSKNC